MRLFFSALLAASILVGCSKSTFDERDWVAMGTTASVKWSDTAEFPVDCAVMFAKKDFEKIERLLNAHDAGSELSRLAVLSDAEILEKCDPEMKPCYETAFKLRELSDGAFDPRWRGTNTLDLGAIAKGFAVDYAMRQWMKCDVRQDWRILLDLGGNLKSAGVRGWKVGIAGSSGIMNLTNGMACATSGEYFRGKHIYDARTGCAVTNDLMSVTIVHPSSAMLADGLSTICFIFGEKEGEAFLKKFYPEARAIWIKKDSPREGARNTK